MNDICKGILEEYKRTVDDYELVRELASKSIEECLKEKNVPVCIFESRTKGVGSLEGKLERKWELYSSIWDLTDLVGLRIVTYYTHDVDRIAAVMSMMFDVDTENSVDKRSLQLGDSFGYLSLHIICSIPKSMYYDPERPQINKIKFELQIRTLLQHMWAATDHDTGYKSDVEIPVEFKRRFSRLAGLLEIADEEYSSLVAELETYRKAVRKLAKDNKLGSESLNKDTFDVYMGISVDSDFMNKIAVSFDKEVVKEPWDVYYEILRAMGFITILEVDEVRKDCEMEAYRMAMLQLSESDSETISSNIMFESIIIIYIIKKYGMQGLIRFYEHRYGTTEGAEDYARHCMEMAVKANPDLVCP